MAKVEIPMWPGWAFELLGKDRGETDGSRLCDLDEEPLAVG